MILSACDTHTKHFTKNHENYRNDLEIRIYSLLDDKTSIYIYIYNGQSTTLESDRAGFATNSC